MGEKNMPTPMEIWLLKLLAGKNVTVSKARLDPSRYMKHRT